MSRRKQKTADPTEFWFVASERYGAEYDVQKRLFVCTPEGRERAERLMRKWRAQLPMPDLRIVKLRVVEP